MGETGLIKASENDVKFFRPLWRRVAVMVVLVVWCIVEYLYGDSFFLMIVLFAIAYCAWTLFIKFPKEEDIAVQLNETAPEDDPASPSDPDTKG